MLNKILTNRWLISLLMLLALLVVVVGDAQAGGKRGRFRHARRPAPSYAETRHKLNNHYPKYYYGFHSSYIHNMGIPSGDIGLRGNGVFMSPW